MIIRIRSPTGQHRLNVSDADAASVDIGALYRLIAAELKLPPQTQFVVSNQPTGDRPYPNTGTTPISALGIRHGTLLHVKIISMPAFTSASTESAPTQTPSVVQDAVDTRLDSESGLIPRPKDPKFCRHGPNGMCDYCMPLEPYDAAYREEHKIKHMSFHAYLRQLSGASKQKVSLSEPSFTVARHCDAGHAPYPKSMCAKCQPSAIVLQQQTYRMVDHVEFETAQLVDNFISFWRQTGLQRFGYLYGRYEVYDKVPLGVKAVVAAIYEPPQTCASDGIQLSAQDPQQQASVDSVARDLGLQVVGMIYTDLVDDGSGTGKVVCRRHLDSFFVSSAECVFMARSQLRHPSPCKHSPATGHFGSKFVTVVVSGDKENNIHLSAYQVSNTAAAMVRDQIVDACTDPNSMRVQQSDGDHYVPEVFYKFKNEYGVQVQQAAKPTFPVEYFLVTLTEGFPSVPTPSFTSQTPFAVANRQLPGSHQSMEAVRDTLQANPAAIEALSDFHLLTFLCGTGLFNQDDLSALVRLVRDRPPDFDSKLAANGAWLPLVAIVKELGSAAAPASGGTGSSSAKKDWACAHCTFVNSGKVIECAMCGLPQTH